MRPIFINRDPTRPASGWNVLSIVVHDRVATDVDEEPEPLSALSGTGGRVGLVYTTR
jgi:hypothetical protein